MEGTNGTLVEDESVRFKALCEIFEPLLFINRLVGLTESCFVHDRSIKVLPLFSLLLAPIRQLGNNLTGDLRFAV